ncbi:FtsW/RodA/SpoVE family cell cycle protein [Alkalibacter rhizosphaerae]|uniref:FtsW/RodA/SpoVE family cell cycle protein n=1 Tax=Alkalibacter rhizosphaerae TaxID=2815577 RepID=A0A975AIK3_9FIRM|nr:FtsW/RodA/SpoVE family cell cycle protein [Alkalibacter rhizosphaerae]QSX08620.1 FtsW/RodA/SpoVE family cell cycle protein [Alkalibacter rhizosphaerae]
MRSSKPYFLIVLYLFLSFFLLSIRNGSFEILPVIYAAVVSLSIGVVLVFMKRFRWGDGYLFLITSMISSIGIVFLYRLDPQIGQRQILWFGAGILAFFLGYLVFVIGYRLWSHPKMLLVYPLVSFTFFVMTLTMGERIGGAINWIVINGIQVQPWEGIKLLFVFFMASYYAHQQFYSPLSVPLGKKGIQIPHKLLFMGGVYLHLLFLVLQREWGGSILFFLVFIAMMYVFDGNKKHLLANALAAAAGGTGGYLLLSHIQVRVATWLDPWRDMDGTGYQITQSLFALGSGGFFGTGLGLGRPHLIPAVHTDFIFSAITEEMGIFGGVGIILLYFILVYRGFKLVIRMQEPFLRAVAFGITSIFGFQTFIIIGGVIKLIPLTGITLPFVSYGGSSLISSFLALGILQGISATGISFFPTGEQGGDEVE